MTPYVAIPEPTSLDPAYNERSLRPYLEALEAAGASPLVISSSERPEQIAQMLQSTRGILLPGSRYDVDPERYGEDRMPECAPSDPARAAVDELLFQDAFNLHKPILAICYGVQALNVWCNGSLYQDLEAQMKTPVNHRPGREVQRAHAVTIASGSRLASIAAGAGSDLEAAELWVNSSHHQAVQRAGDKLRISAISPEDGVIEGIELKSSSHFVVGVQWHPERTYSLSLLSRALFTEFVRIAAHWEPRRIAESVAQ
jgi:putative glutamine amidotransferase